MWKTLATVFGVFAFFLIALLLYGLFPASAQTNVPGCAGVKTCECCHPEVIASLGKTAMGRLFIKHPRTSTEELVCETCHGPGQVHADSEGEKFGDMIRFAKGSPTPIQRRNEACLQCHEKKQNLFWEGSVHELRNVACTSCHKSHQNIQGVSNSKLLTKPTVMETCNECHKQPVAQQMRFSHHPLREGKMDCTSCHNPHGTVSEHLLKGNGTTQVCYSCHPEIRGPFLFEHPPVREDCSNCHTPHGSNYTRLLKVPELRLCRECHTGFHQLQFQTARRAVVPHIAGRMCTDCHINIHGSNHPAGVFLTR